MKGLVRGQSTPLLNQYAPIIWYVSPQMGCDVFMWAFVSFDLCRIPIQVGHHWVLDP